MATTTTVDLDPLTKPVTAPGRRMPSSSPKQARFMAAAAHDPRFAKKAGVPQKVAKEFNAADAKSKLLKPGPRPKKQSPIAEMIERHLRGGATDHLTHKAR